MGNAQGFIGAEVDEFRNESRPKGIPIWLASQPPPVWLLCASLGDTASCIFTAQVSSNGRVASTPSDHCLMSIRNPAREKTEQPSVLFF